MEIIIYSTKGCFYCQQMKELCNRAGVEYKENDIPEKGELRQNFINKYPNAAGFPWVIIDGEEVGGLVEAAKYFIKRGMVRAKRD